MTPQDQGPHEETYAGDDRAAREAAAESEGGGLFAQVFGEIEAKSAADDYARGQAGRLGQGVSTRSGPSMPGTYYLGYEHPAMKSMVETNMDPGQVNETGAAWNNLGNTLVEFQAAVAAAVGNSTEDWSGVAGGAARSYFSGVGEWMGGTGQAFQLAANRMNAQSEAAAMAKAAMPEPVDFSMRDALDMLQRETNPLKLPNTVDQINQKFAEKQEAHQRAAEVMTTFAQSMGESGSGMPAFVTAPAMAAPHGEEPRRPDTGGPVGPRASGPREGGNSPGIWEPGTRGPAPAAPRGGEDPIADSPPGETPMQSWQLPPTGGLPPLDGGAPDRPVPVGHESSRPLPTGGVPIGGGYPRAGWESQPRLGSGGQPEAGGRGPSGRPGAGGEAGSGGRSPGGRLGGEPGGRSAGGLAGEHATGRGGPAGRGASGAGVGPMGVGGRPREEDKEHQRPSYLEEPNPEEVFGTDERTAPPVIGEDDD